MGDIVNLKLHRKRRERAERQEGAAANRAKFGRTKAERELTKAQAKKDEDTLDGHKRDE